ncbi:MFS transporter [Aeoliella mucimassa]|uniref:Major Facilitator Superfamily protein n=1 Tax=Aeoliella mucimassa TaxID=2527972 RepID=A0A518ALQ6_9BACT|nr:MFS transporter [Aeoliella mucimassa]QDU55657.1 Major Facilitator Superfamily protein [Aeoliella mucimassa]
MSKTPAPRTSMPADPAYAWVMIPVAILMQAGTSPGQSFGVSLFMGPIREELGLSETSITGAYMIASALAALPLMGIGRLMDRWGLRIVSMALVLAVGSACFAISKVQGVVGLTCAFFALRAFGQGALSMAASNTLGTWFSRRLGVASGLAGIGMSATVAIVPLGILALIQQYGWRDAYAIVGGIVIAILMPLMLVVYRNNTKVVEVIPSENEPPVSDGPDFTLAEAVRTPTYWVAVAATALTGMIATALFINLSRLFSENGFTAEQAALVFPISATAMGIMQIKGGLLADHIPLRILLGSSILLLGTSALCLGMPGSIFMAYVGAAALGANQGLLQVTGNTLWPRYFGRRNLGSIRSSVWTAMVISCSVGPFIMGFTLELLGSYDASVWLFVSLSTVIAVAAFGFAGPPVPVAETEETPLQEAPAMAS